MVGLCSASKIWGKLQVYYVSHTRAKIVKLKTQLKAPKHDQSISTYLFDIKKIVDTLAATGSSLTNEEHLEAIFYCSAKFTNPTTMTTLRIHNLLHVPSINKNLMSVSQFAKDNSVYFEFFPNHCFVKNQDTKKIILQEKVKDDLYVFPIMQCSLKPFISNTTFNPASFERSSYHILFII